MADTFNETDKQTSGVYANGYIWSDLKNWSTGALPGSSDAVTINSTASAPSIDDVALTVASITLASGGTLAVASTLTTGVLGGGGPVTVNRGGTLEVTKSMSSAESFVLNGGSLRLDSSVALTSGTAFSFGASSTYGTSALYIADTANFSQTNFNFAINAMDAGDSLQFGTMSFSSAVYSSTYRNVTLTVSGSTTTYTLTNFRNPTSQTFSLSTAAGGGTIITLNCFLAGTRIDTPGGPVAIETLSAGDLVITLEQDTRVPRPIRWIGTRLVDPEGMDADMAQDAAPVRIRADAFADGIPARDLLVTSDHCIFEAGGLTPARMLVNGASIVREAGRLPYRVYHIECDTHSILISEGLTTESFLDTGARAGFGLVEPMPPLAGGRLRSVCWLEDAAAPLVTTRAEVEPIWRRLAARAEALGMGLPSERRIQRTTADPALRLRLEDGSWLRPRRRRGDRHFFVLPAGVRRATLQSRSAVPADVEGVYVDDRRRLGVMVRRATLWTELHSTELELGGEDDAGWHRPETLSSGRWTDGDGSLALPSLPHATMLELELSGTLSYPLADDQAHRPPA